MTSWDAPGPAFQRLLNSIRSGVMGQNEYRVLNMPRCRFIRTVAQTFAAGVVAPVQFDVPPPVATCWDTDSMFLSIAGPPTSTRVTCKTSGVYAIAAQLVFEASAAGATRQAWLAKNTAGVGGGTRYGWEYKVVVAAIAGFFYCNIHVQMQLVKGDYIELFGLADVGPTLSSTNGGLHPTSEIAACLLSTL